MRREGASSGIGTWAAPRGGRVGEGRGGQGGGGRVEWSGEGKGGGTARAPRARAGVVQTARTRSPPSARTSIYSRHTSLSMWRMKPLSVTNISPQRGHSKIGCPVSTMCASYHCARRGRRGRARRVARVRAAGGRDKLVQVTTSAPASSYRLSSPPRPPAPCPPSTPPLPRRRPARPLEATRTRARGGRGARTSRSMPKG